MSAVVFRQVLPFPISDVWGMHATPGIVTRLTPGFTGIRILQEAGNLKSGLTRMRFPGGAVWEGQHDPAVYRPLVPATSAESPARFSDVCDTPVFGWASGWRHTHSFFPDATRPHHTILHDEIRTNAPAALAERALQGIFGFRQDQLAGDLRRLTQVKQWSGPTTEKMLVAVAGADTAVGAQLCAMLQLAGHRVIRLTSDPHAQMAEAGFTGAAPLNYRFCDPKTSGLDALDEVEAVVHVAEQAGTEQAGTGGRATKVTDFAEMAASTDSVHTFVAVRAGGAIAGAGSSAAGSGAPSGAADLIDAETAGLRVVDIHPGAILAGGSGLLASGTLPPLGALPLPGTLQRLARTVERETSATGWISINDVVDIALRGVTDPMLHGVVEAIAGGPPNILTRLGHEFRTPDLRGTLRHELGKNPARALN